MTTYTIEQRQFIARPRKEVFSFFSDAANLERITPDFLHFRIVTPAPIEIKTGTLIDYRLSLHGIPLRWRTRIAVFNENHSFTDIQLKGPYRTWHHVHEFSDVAGGTEMRDFVEYELPFGPLGDVVRYILVQHSLRKIFEYRRQAIDAIFNQT